MFSVISTLVTLSNFHNFQFPLGDFFFYLFFYADVTKLQNFDEKLNKLAKNMKQMKHIFHQTCHQIFCNTVKRNDKDNE